MSQHARPKIHDVTTLSFSLKGRIVGLRQIEATGAIHRFLAQLEGDILRLDPSIPKAWPRFEMTVRLRSARYDILVEDPDGVCHGVVAATMDRTAILQPPLDLKVQDDGVTHRVLVRLG